MIVAFDGIDCTGKTSLIIRLANHFRQRGKEVLLVNEFPSEFYEGFLEKSVRSNPALLPCEDFACPKSQTLVLLAHQVFKF